MQKRIAVEIIALVGLSVALYAIRRHSNAVDTAIASHVLPTDEQEKLIINPKAHTVTIVTAKGTQTKYFPPNETSSVDVSKNGAVMLRTRTFGTEYGLALSAAYSDKLRVGLAVPLLYYKRLELEPMLLIGVSPKLDARLAVAVSYNLYSNTSLFVGMQTTREPVGGIQVRF